MTETAVAKGDGGPAAAYLASRDAEARADAPTT
jgi:hypothetical protein